MGNPCVLMKRMDDGGMDPNHDFYDLQRRFLLVLLILFCFLSWMMRSRMINLDASHFFM